MKVLSAIPPLLRGVIGGLLMIWQTSCDVTGIGRSSAMGEPMQMCRAEPDHPDFVEESPYCVLQRGTAEWYCGDRRIEVTYITPHGLTQLGAQCNHPLGMVLSYSGEIDRSLLTLIQNMAGDADSFDEVRTTVCRTNPGEDGFCSNIRPTAISLFINSPGGDAEAALEMSEIISNRAWRIFVRQGDRCYSACVFLLVAARERVVLGEVGIHRVYPSGSAAATTEDLTRDLEGIVARAKALMQRNGVNPSLVDDMMSVPSSDVRILSGEERDAYGLGHDNAAQVDLERLGLERRCGVDFVQRRLQAEAHADQCEASFWWRGAYGEFATCVNTANQQLGFPDAACPNDGPTFWCGPDGQDPAKSCEP